MLSVFRTITIQVRMSSQCVTFLFVFPSKLIREYSERSLNALLLFSLGRMLRYYLYLQLLCLWFLPCTPILYGDICKLL
jgi:hypothetical protein